MPKIILILMFVASYGNCLHVDIMESNIDNVIEKEANTIEDHETGDDFDYAFIENLEDTSNVSDEFGEERYRRSISRKVTTIYPELLVVVDNALYKKLGYSKSATKEYIINFISAVNIRFQSIKNPGIQLNIADIQIGTSKLDTPYISKNIMSGSGYFDAHTALKDAGSYFYGKTYPGVVYDIVLVLTAEEMCRYKSKGKKCHPSTAGYAYVGGACKVNKPLKKINSIGLVEDDGGYSGVVIAAHELGHLLGASHDGQYAPTYLGGPGAKSCSPGNGYIMSDNRRTERGLQWSTCSLKQFKYYLESDDASCMYNSPTTIKYPLISYEDLTARVSSADEQCKMEAGTSACFKDDKMCTQLYCLNPKTGSCTSYRPAVEGTSCGSSKFCSNGKCIKKSTLYFPLKTSKFTSTSRAPMILSRSSTPWKTSKRPSSSRTVITTTTTFSTVSPWKTTPIVTSSSTPRLFAALTSNEVCSDMAGPMGYGLKCHELFQRYSFLYCKNSRMKTKCCKSYEKYCN